MNHATTTPTNMNSTDTRSAVEIMEESKSLYERKNDDYGDSWRLVGKTFAMWLRHLGEDELRVPATEYHLNALGLFTRRMDKLIREFNGWMVFDEGEEYRVSESIVETHNDDVPYGAMHTQLAEEYANADPEEILP